MLTSLRRWLNSGSVALPAGGGKPHLPSLEKLEDRFLPATIQFAVIGDFGTNSKAEGQVAALVKSWNPEFIATLGDNNYPDGGSASLDGNVGRYYSDYIGGYSGSYGPGAPTNRFFPALGNHDWGTRSGKPPLPKPHTDYFSLPGNERYYTYTRGPVQFFVLDSGDGSGTSSDGFEPDGITSDSTQGRWLRDALSRSTSPWQVVCLHHPPHSSGPHGGTPVMRWPFKEWGADLVLAGHDHVYERLEQDGLPFLVNGVGGASLTEFGPPVDGSDFRRSGVFGALRGSANESYLRMEMVGVDGRVVDTLMIEKSASPTGTISGTSFLDINGDGVRGTGEPLSPGNAFFLDRDIDGTLDDDESVRVTDSAGAFEFGSLAPGTYLLRRVPIPGQSSTGLAAQGFVAIQITAGQSAPALEVGLRDNSGLLPFSVSPRLFTPPATDAWTGFVKNLYRSLLGREGDSAGVANWVARLQSGVARSVVVASFLASDEWNGRLIASYYRNWLGRDPDSAGLAYWVSRMAGGMKAESVALIFISSPEAMARNPGNRGFVQSLYSSFLGRTGSSVEVSGWETALNQKRLARADLARSFLRSAESARRISASLYIQFLHRRADQAGVSAWSSAFQSGTVDSAGMILAFLSSAEFQTKAAA